MAATLSGPDRADNLPDYEIEEDWFDNATRAGRASDYIGWARADAPWTGPPVVLVARVSGSVQDREGNLARALAHLQQWSQQTGASVVGFHTHVGSGYDPEWIDPAVGVAKGHDAAIVAGCVDRLVRSPYYSKEHQRFQARRVDLSNLVTCAAGTPLFTVLNPDATPSEERSFHIRLGQEVSGRLGGRPRQDRRGALKRRREQLQPLAIEHYRQGRGYREIAKLMKVPTMTVYGWLRSVRN